MTNHNKEITTTLNHTIDVLGGDLASTSADQGVDMIQQWIEIVKGNVNTEWVAEPLEKLRNAIQANNTHEIEGLMNDLSGITIDFANNTAKGHYKEELQNLSTVLKDFAQELSKAHVH